MSEQKLKFSILSRLIDNEDPDVIAANLQTSKAKVLRCKRELDQAKLNDTVYQLMDMTKEEIEALGEQLAVSSPGLLADTSEESMGELVKSKDAAAVLQENMQNTGNYLTDRIKSFAMGATTAGELSVLAETLCMLQNAFFNKNTTQVNVQNNFERPYAQFLSDQPADH